MNDVALDALKRELLELLLAEAQDDDGLPPLLPADRSVPLPLSWAQQRLWFLDQLDQAAGGAYHMPVALRLRGALDVPALRAALLRIVERHENLRTCFVDAGEGPQQRILVAADAFALPVDDLSALAPDARETAVATQAAAEAQAPFDLSRGPLVRARLLRCDAQDHVLLVTMHHIVSDGWSMGVLIGEVSALYAAFHAGVPDPLPALPIQYADYAVWQRNWLQGAELERQVSYWRSHLSGAPVLLSLPTDRPRPAMQSYRGAVLPVRLGQSLTHSLQALAQRQGATMFMVLAAAWSLLLSRLSGQTDVVIGTPLANRQRAELEGLIGFFVNTLALRLPVDAAWTTDELLTHTRETVLSGFGHQDVPFEQVVEALQPARSLSYSPVFQAMLSLNNTPDAGELSLDGLHLETLAQPHETTHFDLSLSLAEVEGGLVGGLEYASDLFDAATMQRWIGHLEVLLDAMVTSPQTAVGALPLLRPAQRRELLEDFNATGAAYPEQALVHALFEAQVACTPDAMAVDAENVRWTYAELNARANHLAYALRAQGVSPDARVALCLERGAPMLMAVLAVLKAGGAYVPLDPSYPRERLAYMLEDSAPVGIITDAASRDRLPESAQAQALDVDSDWNEWPADDLPTAGTTSDHLAYVIYTSGSTGRPKGVMVEHRNVVHLWQALEREVFGALPPQARIGLNAGLSFDASVQSWSQLLSGRCVVPVPASVRTDAEAMRRFVLDRSLAMLDCTPGQLELLRWQDGSGPQVVLVGGEALTGAQWQRMSAEHRRYFNVYGPTECTVDTTLGEVAGEGPHIGRPLPNTRVYLLDEQGEPVPMGVVGELWIGGAGVARGYLNQEALTQTRFVPDRFAGTGRMYRSGDLGRYRSDGAIEFLGRNDAQVKLRGFRIELGEIESSLCALDGVREAAVMVRGHEAQRQLVAYVVADGQGDSPQSCRAQLLQRLPEHMVPSAYVRLAALPLTPNGKLDRQALPAPDDEAVARRAYRAPEGTTERAIADVWCDLLGLERVGRDDHFFELGGHSLLAVSLSRRLQDLSGRRLSLAALFMSPRLADLAAALDRGQPSGERLVRLNDPARGPTLFCLPPIGGEVHFYHALAQALAGSCDVYGVAARAPGEDRTAEQAIAGYCTAIERQQPQGPYHLAGWSSAGAIAAAVAEVLERRGHEVAYLGLIDAAAPMRDPTLAQCEQLAHSLAMRAMRERHDPASEVELQEMQARFAEQLRLMGSWRPRPLRTQVHAVMAAEAAIDHPLYRALEGLTGEAGPAARVEQAPGDHHSMLDARHAPALAGRIAHAIAHAGVNARCG
ncbi:amino acid adenylation domain-containing protein [Xanthomonas campestris pv. campestris]|nr:amino acid adenylation domain-containing protein [Xanthomonas campestris pv. campestris]MEB1308998.1 amino acid adenylation domain-containing protein [Xanthomonas campestris pv. campestris]MEB1334071.1 amino acid adenylation domain-containing protein [Xanthomonas campestris pv. campestris]